MTHDTNKDNLKGCPDKNTSQMCPNGATGQDGLLERVSMSKHPMSERLRDEAIVYEHYGYSALPVREAADELDRLQAQNTRLSEIVEKLPRTADGVPVGPGSLVYVNLSNTPRWRGFGVSTLYIEGWDTRTEVAVFRNTPEGNMPGELDSVFFEIEDTYSTPEAAEAARVEPDKEQR